MIGQCQETVHNVINLCALFNVGVDATCASNAVHKVPIVSVSRQISSKMGRGKLRIL